MKQTLIKITGDHYVVVDDSEIKEGDWLYSFDNGLIVQANRASADTINSKSLNGRGYGKITHSTQPLDTIILKNRDHSQSVGQYYGDGGQLSLQEVKELIGEVDVDKKVEEVYPQTYYSGIHIDGFLKAGYVKGYNQALEDNKEKKWTDEDIEWAIVQAFLGGIERGNDFNEVKNKIIQSLQPKTEWEVEIVDGKLKLL